MIELAQHIEVLLLENDCVIVPGLGGFVAHYMPATRVEEENLFLPPSRTIGFNPQLTMNDGLLVQSVMSATDTGYSDASRLVEAAVQQLVTTLHEDGKVELPNVGELRCSIHGTCSFRPYDNRLTTPYLYGLDSFEMLELSALRAAASPAKVVAQPAVNKPTARKEKTKRLSPRLKRLASPAHWGAAAAVAVIMLLSFFFSTPIENTEIIQGNYAQLMPCELFSQIEKQSLTFTAVAVAKTTETVETTKTVETKEVVKSEAPLVQPKVDAAKVDSKVDSKVAEAELTKAETTAETKSLAVAKKESVQSAAITKAPVTAKPAAKKRYHIIVASVGSKAHAEALSAKLVKQGHAGAHAVIGDGKSRVSINAFATHAEAYEALKQIRTQAGYESAWVLKR